MSIKADGTCHSQTQFGPPSGEPINREVTATYRRFGKKLFFNWQGAGRTQGTLENTRFSMLNEGILFEYERIED